MTIHATGGALEATAVSKKLGRQRVLEDISLSVSAGSTTAIVGPSGAGKTTLLRIIAGFLTPDAGDIRLDGRLITGTPPHRRRIGLVAQDGALFPHLNVARNIAFGMDSAGLGRTQRMERVAELLDLVSLPADYASRRPDELSGGQRQRVALARALARKPDLILLDEPFSSLDAALRERTRKAVQKVLRATGSTALLVTHDQDEALSFANQVAVLTEGRLRQAGEPQSIYTEPSDLEIAQFLGDAVVLPATVTGGVADCVLGEVSLRNTIEDGSATLMLRPEQVAVVPAGEGVLGVVLDSDYFGHDTTATVRIHGDETIVRLRQLNSVPLEPGTTIGLLVEGRGSIYPAQKETTTRIDLASNV